MRVDVVVLNYNGRRLLEQCLPSVLREAEHSCCDCRVVVIDNRSTDDSRELLAQRFKQVHVVEHDNRGLCSYNNVLANLNGQVALLLNNDVQLERGAIDALLDPHLDPTLTGRRRLLFTAPQCWRSDDQSYEGFRTAVTWSWGLLQASWEFDGYDAGVDRPGLTASAGAALAVDRELFLKLGGFDPLYLPGRLEDLDLAFRGYQAGYVGWYVPEAKVLHHGAATFEEVYGRQGCDDLALRNTLLFQWKNLRWPGHRLRLIAGLGARLVYDVFAAPAQPDKQRWRTARALLAALRRGHVAANTPSERHPPDHDPWLGRRWWKHVRREVQWLHRFSHDQMGGRLHPQPTISYRRLLGLDEPDAPSRTVDTDVAATAAGH